MLLGFYAARSGAATSEEAHRLLSVCGQNIDRLGTDYLEELMLFNAADLEDLEEAQEEAKDG